MKVWYEIANPSKPVSFGRTEEIAGHAFFDHSGVRPGKLLKDALGDDVDQPDYPNHEFFEITWSGASPGQGSPSISVRPDLQAWRDQVAKDALKDQAAQELERRAEVGAVLAALTRVVKRLVEISGNQADPQIAQAMGKIDAFNTMADDLDAIMTDIEGGTITNASELRRNNRWR